MNIKGNGVEVRVNPAEQSDEWLLGAATEINEEAEARGLELSVFVGKTAVEGKSRDLMDAMLDFEAENHEAFNIGSISAVEIKPTATETKESIAEQLTAATKGYQEVMTALNIGRRGKKKLPVLDEAIAPEFDLWLTDEKLAYVRAAQEADPNVRFTLVATPNIQVDAKDIAKIAEVFGAIQLYEINIWDKLYNKYSPQELSGNITVGSSVRFSLIPSTYTPEMTSTVGEQRTKLAKLQTENPYLKVPSVLDAITYWNTLRATGNCLEGDGTFDKTYIRHFDLDEKRLGVRLCVPYSYVNDNGKPDLYYSDILVVNDVRLSVG